MLKIKRALISVWDKKGIVDLAEFLQEYKVEIVSTGGTYKLLKEKGITVREVSKVTGFPEIMNGRVKTLHPAIHGGLLADKNNSSHIDQIAGLGIKPFDLVVVNLYPFCQMMKKNLSFEEMVEYIDIGGPTMLRAAAKNMGSVLVSSGVEQYSLIKKEMKKNKGSVPFELCRIFAGEVFEQTFRYDMAIADFLNNSTRRTIMLEQKQSLRYGENPHQSAGLYIDKSENNAEYKQLGGKELSFNNMMDINAAVKIVQEFVQPASSVIKHTIPCGAAVADTPEEAYVRAYSCDPVSSFGGIIGFNCKVTPKAAQEIIQSGFREVVAAPSFDKDAVKILSAKKNLRIIRITGKIPPDTVDIKRITAGYLLQDEDVKKITGKDLTVVTKKGPTQKQIDDLLFAWRVCRHVKSNAIVAAKDGATIGIGGGFTARIDAAEYAYKKAVIDTKGAVIASDAFFPYPDNVELAAKQGIAAIIQPGGSVKDPEVIEACDKYGIAMVFTGVRHFKH